MSTCLCRHSEGRVLRAFSTLKYKICQFRSALLGIIATLIKAHPARWMIGARRPLNAFSTGVGPCAAANSCRRPSLSRSGFYRLGLCEILGQNSPRTRTKLVRIGSFQRVFDAGRKPASKAESPSLIVVSCRVEPGASLGHALAIAHRQTIVCTQRLGGMLRCYRRAAA